MVSTIFDSFRHSKQSIRGVFLAVGIGALSLGSNFNTVAQNDVSAPLILTQPVAETVDYGANALFSVVAAGDATLTYQWQRNGENLVDFENVSGAVTSSVAITGVAANDTGNYRVIVTGIGGSITSAPVTLAINPTGVFRDDFESGSSNWFPLLKGQKLVLNGLRNHSAGGSWSALMTNSSQAMYHNLGVQYGCRLDFSFWFFDNGQSQVSAGGELRGYSGPGYARYTAPGGLRQLIAIGRYNEAFPSNGSGQLVGEVLNTNTYQARIAFGTNSGWFNLPVNRSQGWHKFRIDRAGSALKGGRIDFYVDGTLAKSVQGVSVAAVDSVFLGSFDLNQSNQVAGAAFFDDVAVLAYPGLFDWQNLASKGAIPDWMQASETGTNWEVRTLVPSVVASIDGGATNSATGKWLAEGLGIYSTDIRGELQYLVTVPADDAFRIEIEGREHSFKTPLVDLPLEVLVDDESLGKHNLPYGNGTNGLLHCFTPYLKAGQHSLRIKWDNTDAYRSLLLQGIRFQTLSSPLDSTVGMKGWVRQRLATQNAVETCPAASFVSPVCMEGRGQFLSMMKVYASGSNQLEALLVQHGAGHRWYANAPLLESSPTTVLTSFQNDGLIQSNQVVWEACNLLLNTNDLVIRRGDALRFTAMPEGATNGEVDLAINGTNQWVIDASTPAACQFQEPGIYYVTGLHVPSGQAGVLNVTVMDATFGESPIARVFHARYWNCTNLPPGVVVDADPRLKLTPVSDAERAGQTPPLAPAQTNEQEFRLYTRTAQPEYILARIGQGGPILTNVAVRGFRWTIAPDTYLRVIGTNSDGSQLIETGFVASPCFPSLSVGVQIISSGVTFNDGTITKALTSEDFETTGIARVRFIRPTAAKGSTCHTTKLFDGGVLIGWR